MDENQVEINIPEPQYTLVDVKRDGMPEILMVNKALLAFPHSQIFSWYLRVTIEAQELVDHRMPAPGEQEMLYRIGDEIEASVLDGRTGFDAVNALFLARSTWNGLRELLFLVHDPEIAHSALQALLNSRRWEREWDYRMDHDPEWEGPACVFQVFASSAAPH
jgi:hypothetical protein